MRFLALCLLFLIFISKISFSFLAIPSQISMLVFQYGLHPYLNIILNFVIGLPIMYFVLGNSSRIKKMRPSYRSMLFLLMMGFFLETLLQGIFTEENRRGFFSWAALASTGWLILIFGVFIPSFLNLKTMLHFISHWSLALVGISLGMWLLYPELVFKGGRYVGVFKHIPHMVTCATLGVVFTLGRLSEVTSGFKRLLLLMGIGLSFFSLVLTGTRSALLAALFAVMLWVLKLPSCRPAVSYFKYSLLLFFAVVLLLFGKSMGSYAYGIATGKQALFEREAQDGVASRFLEIERGWGYFQTSPWIGRGLLAKFSGNEGLDVRSYNSFKDPHNIFVSAGVVGGWPFIWWTGIFLVLLMGFAIKALTSENAGLHVMAIYILVQIPILVIYHWHLSLGGMADRIYWLVFGYLALASESHSNESRDFSSATGRL